MALRRPKSPCECGCGDLAARLAQAEALNGALVRAVVALRPIASGHTVQRGLEGWGVRENDARLLAEAIRQRPA